MSAKHTPGPWMARTAPTSAGLCHIVSAPDWKGAFIYGDGIRPGVDDALPKAQELAANARLIAAAPELLEALQGMNEAYCRAGFSLTKAELHEDRMRLIAARAAIAKATGGAA